MKTLNRPILVLVAAIFSFAQVAYGQHPSEVVPPVDDFESQALEAWRTNIERAEVPGEGCFHASYPSTVWVRTTCSVARGTPYSPPARLGIAQTVGHGVGYVAS